MDYFTANLYNKDHVLIKKIKLITIKEIVSEKEMKLEELKKIPYNFVKSPSPFMSGSYDGKEFCNLHMLGGENG